jgi:antitoxin YefM
MSIMENAPALTLPVTDVKQRLLELLKKAQQYRESIMITKNGTPAGVLLGIEEYESLVETIEILSDPDILKSLRKSRQEAKKGKFFSDDEVWD